MCMCVQVCSAVVVQERCEDLVQAIRQSARLAHQARVEVLQVRQRRRRALHRGPGKARIAEFNAQNTLKNREPYFKHSKMHCRLPES